VSSKADLLRTLGTLSEPPAPEHRRLAELLELPAAPTAEEYAAVFLFELYPYASVYLGPEGMLGGEARDRVAGAWTALGRPPPAEPDHLGALLGLYASLIEQEDSETRPAEAAMWGAAAAGFLWEHLLSWALPYLDRFGSLGTSPYADWARVLTETLVAEAGRHGPPASLPLHLREAPGLPDPRRVGSEAFVRGLLAPARSGLILTRSDLARAASETGLGLRLAERSFALESLLSQDSGRTLGWLSAQADRWARRHEAWEAVLGPVAAFWSDRATAAGELLDSLLDPDGMAPGWVDDALQGSEVVDAGD
jgi:TorA maturation chaperone TorD